MYWFEASIERMAKRAAEQIGLSDSTYRQMGGRGSEYQSSVDRQRRQQELTMKPGDPRRRTDEQIRTDTYNQGLHGNTPSPAMPRTSAASTTTRAAQPAVRPQQPGAAVPQGYDPEGNPVGNRTQLERQERERRMAEARGASAETNKQNRIADAQAGGNGQYMQSNGTLNAPEGAEVQGEWRNGKFYPHGSQFGYTAKEVARNKWNVPAQPEATPVQPVQPSEQVQAVATETPVVEEPAAVQDGGYQPPQSATPVVPAQNSGSQQAPADKANTTVVAPQVSVSGPNDGSPIIPERPGRASNRRLMAIAGNPQGYQRQLQEQNASRAAAARDQVRRIAESLSPAQRQMQTAGPYRSGYRGNWQTPSFQNTRPRPVFPSASQIAFNPLWHYQQRFAPQVGAYTSSLFGRS